MYIYTNIYNMYITYEYNYLDIHKKHPNFVRDAKAVTNSLRPKRPKSSACSMNKTPLTFNLYSILLSSRAKFLLR
jgi:hypothetical protein